MIVRGNENGKAAVDFSHLPVMLDEVIDGLDIKENGIYIDGTAGGAGHSSAIAARLTGGRLISLDRDEVAVAVAKERLARFGDRSTVVHAEFSDMARVCRELGVERVDGVLLDLGVSSYQLDTAARGFSYMSDAALDMRMDRSQELDAAKVVNTYSAEELSRIIREYGEEKFAYRIACGIVAAREKKPIETTGELVEIIRSALPDGGRSQKHHPAMRTFQAIRIEVNGELALLPRAISDAVSLLAPGGRLAVITFHSLEDRIVKNLLSELASGCVCPADFPVCVCGRKPQIKLCGKKPRTASPRELEINGRAHSAKLRIAEKL